MEGANDFLEWDVQGRGLRDFGSAVHLEAAFWKPAYLVRHAATGRDDGRRETWLSRRLSRSEPQTLALRAAQQTVTRFLATEAVQCTDLVEVEILGGRDEEIVPASWGRVLTALGGTDNGTAFEMVGHAGRATCGFAVKRTELHVLERVVGVESREAVLRRREAPLARMLLAAESPHETLLAFGLSSAFVRPLRHSESFAYDPLSPIVSALGSAGLRTCALFQVLFQRAEHPWGPTAVLACTDRRGGPLFRDAPDLPAAAREFAAEPTCAVSIRFAATGSDYQEQHRILREVLAGLRQFDLPRATNSFPSRRRRTSSSTS